MGSQSYASYLASREESYQHRAHIYEFQTLFSMICKETIEEYMNTKIEPMINDAVSKAINNAFSGAINGINLDVNRIVDFTITGLSNQYHKVSKEVDEYLADALSTELKKALSNIDINLIIK